PHTPILSYIYICLLCSCDKHRIKDSIPFFIWDAKLFKCCLTLNLNEDESIVSFLDQLSGRIIERGRTIEDSINKTIEFDTIPYNSIVLK
ncbi:MAG: hypothetical protein KH303_10800, partial [Firmicutes bacterium]|nr:hypothetical protein [Bacillota bacterium]